MNVTLRLSDEETEALQRRADLEGRPMEEVARAAVREYLEADEDDVDRAAAWVTTSFREALDRLGRA